MDTFLWWSGVALWGCLSAMGLVIALDWIIDQTIKSLNLYRDLLAFVWERAKARRGDDRLPGG